MPNGFKPVAALTLILFLLAGCVAGANDNTPSPADTAAPPTQTALPPTPKPPTLTPTPTYPWTDENAIMSGICFESAYAFAGQVFVIGSAADHIRFYDAADSSNLCRNPVTRNPFDFNGGQVLAGLWSKGTGCTAHYDVLNVQRDDSSKRLVIWLRFVTEGGCGYELVRGYWIGLSGVSDYDIQFVLQ